MASWFGGHSSAVLHFTGFASSNTASADSGHRETIEAYATVERKKKRERERGKRKASVTSIETLTSAACERSEWTHKLAEVMNRESAGDKKS